MYSCFVRSNRHREPVLCRQVQHSLRTAGLLYSHHKNHFIELLTHHTTSLVKLVPRNRLIKIVRLSYFHRIVNIVYLKILCLNCILSISVFNFTISGIIMCILSGRLILSLHTIIRKKVTCHYYDNYSLMSRIPERRRQLSKQSNISQAIFITSYDQWPVMPARWFSGPHPYIY